MGVDKGTEPEAFNDVVGTFQETRSVEEQQDPEIPSKKPPPESCLRQYAGMLLTLNASLMFSIIVLLVVMLQKYAINSGNVSLWRYAGITLPSLPLLFYFETCGRKKSSQCPNGESVFSTILPLTDKAKLKNFILLMVRRT